MDQVIPSLAELLAPFRPCFRAEAFVNFAAVVDAWLIRLGPRTLSEVWQFCFLQRLRHYCAVYDLFSRASWDWDELGKILLALLLVEFVPSGVVWLAVDDTLCHKRGKRVALGGIFLDPVLSSKKVKVFRYAVNYVVLALVVRPPFRPDRTFALPVLWRAFRKKGTAGHRKKTELARELAHLAALALPGRRVCLVGDGAYVNASVLRGRPANLEVIGPLPLKAAPYRVPDPNEPRRRGRKRTKGERLPTPKEVLAMPEEFVACEQSFALPGGEKALRVQVLRGVLWYTGCKESRVARGGGAAARPDGVVARRGSVVHGRDAERGRGGVGVLPALGDRGGVPRREATPGDAGRPGVVRGERGAGAPDGVLLREPGAAVVRQARAGPARDPAAAAVVQGGGFDVHGDAGQTAPGHLGPTHFRGDEATGT